MASLEGEGEGEGGADEFCGAQGAEDGEAWGRHRRGGAGGAGGWSVGGCMCV